MVYGLPYQGSKNTIAERIVDALPKGTNFVDCCCGGGAILQAVAMSGKFKTVTGYDINKAIVGLIKATMIDFDTIDYEHFPAVTKERFYEARESNSTLEDWLIRYTASFGFKGTEYLWGENRVKYKMLLHNAVAASTIEERRQCLRELMVGITKDKLSESDLKNLCHNEQLTNLNRFHEVEKTMKERKSKTKLQVFCKSMFDIPFERYDVIYFDPPYAETTGYRGTEFSQIMFSTLLRVLLSKGKTVFVSEYNAPLEMFTEVANFKKAMTLKADENKTVTEKLFYGGTQAEYEALPGITQQSDTGSDSAIHDDTDDGTEQAVPVGSEPQKGSTDPTDCYWEDDPKIREAIDNLHDAGQL
jgi:site-specific DNA-adenine methylase